MKIVEEAYDVATLSSSGRNLFAYMDKVLLGWHEAGCKTVSECQAKRAADRATFTESTSPKKKSKSKPEPPRYGDFDINDAFAKALERSYGDSENKEN